MTGSFDLRRTDSNDPALPPLIEQLDRHLYGIYGNRMEFFNQHNGLEYIKHVVIAFDGDAPVGCGSIKAHGPGTVELKRMYVTPSTRGRGLGSRIIAALDQWAGELGFERMILETGHEMPDAVALYEKNGFTRMENYPPYVGVEESWCYERKVERSQVE